MSRSTFATVPTSALVRVVVFCLVAGFVSFLLASTFAGGAGKDAVPYTAVFSDASGLRAGDDVRVAGVKVGRVSSAELGDDSIVEVSFAVEGATELTDTTRAEIRYQNLIGQRFIALVPGRKPGTALGKDATIPVERTQPAIDLTLLFNGLQPLLTTFDAEEINEFGEQVLHVLQGESGTLVGLLEKTATLSRHIADRDQVIGQVVSNMNSLLGATMSHKAEIKALVKGLRTLVGGVARERVAIIDSLEAIDDVAAATGGLLREGRPLIADTVRKLDKVGANLAANRKEFVAAMRAASAVFRVASHVMGYGEWWNLYFCNVKGGSPVGMNYQGGPHSERCR